MRKIITIAVAASTPCGVAGGAAYATTGADSCTTVRDHVTKTDNGHGAPSEWADLVLAR